MKKRKKEIDNKPIIFLSLYVLTLVVIIFCELINRAVDMEAMKIIICVDLLLMVIALILNSKTNTKKFLTLSPIIAVILLLGALIFSKYEDIGLCYIIALVAHLVCTLIISIVGIIDHFTNKKE